MEFDNRIKKEMTEGIVRAILEDAGYRVIDSGIEKVLRELSCMSSLEYMQLRFPQAYSSLPDFTVLDRQQTQKYLVEVKYRRQWSPELFFEIAPQVEFYGEMVLVCINAAPENPRELKLPATYLRCCKLRSHHGKVQAQLKYEDSKGWNHYWKSIDEVEGNNAWWAMSPLEKVFEQLRERESETRITLDKAIKAISGILE